MTREFRLPRQAWLSIGWRTFYHMVGATFASVTICYLLLETFSEGIGQVGLMAAFAAPLLLGGPMIFFMSLKHHELELAYRKLEEAAARDSLTKCLNHGAFVDAVTQRLDTGQGGMLLVIDADHFKSINDRYGHASGDTALKLMVAAIRANLSPGDIVGRLGGEEFGIFVPETRLEKGIEFARKIRLAVSTIEFQTSSDICILSVSVGGAICTDRRAFGELFRIADERLYRVKAGGRNNTDIIVLPPHPTREAIAPPLDNGLRYRGQRVAQG